MVAGREVKVTVFEKWREQNEEKKQTNRQQENRAKEKWKFGQKGKSKWSWIFITYGQCNLQIRPKSNINFIFICEVVRTYSLKTQQDWIKPVSKAVDLVLVEIAKPRIQNYQKVLKFKKMILLFKKR